MSGLLSRAETPRCFKYTKSGLSFCPVASISFCCSWQQKQRERERERERERQKERGSVPGVSIYRELEVMRVWFLRVFVVLFLGFAMF